MFELKHLRTFDSLARTHSMVKTAQELFMTDSALSHQIRDLENRLGCSTFERKSMPINFSNKGHMLVTLAKEVLPLIAKTHQSLSTNDLNGLKLSVECHACFQWLVPVISDFKQRINQRQDDEDFSIEFLSETVFSARQTLLHKQADIVFTSDIDNSQAIQYQKLGQFDMVLVMSPQHALANKTFISPWHLSDETLITYPVELAKLDVFRFFLHPADITPKRHKKVTEANVLIQMVAANLGVAALPHWAVSHYEQQGLVVTRPLTQSGLSRPLYGAFRREDNKDKKLLAFMRLSKTQFSKL
ncbi:MAG: LysR family transcriptional regulator for metE and metH [Phenylobacterium sp.]|jgi:LysR family transcriptional regulator for metE and metH